MFTEDSVGEDVWCSVGLGVGAGETSFTGDFVGAFVSGPLM